MPENHGAPADILIGQPTFEEEGGNAKGEIGAATFAVPTGIAVGNGILAVADAWNHRVLIWHGVPERSNRPADLVLGQATFAEGAANRGAGAPRADTMNWCYGVAIHAGRLLVADTGNRRVLAWNQIPTRNGAPADLVLGQRSFETRDENCEGAHAGARMRWPHAIAADADKLFIADAGNSRVMVWNSWPQDCGAPCDFVLGQSGFAGTDHNRGAYHPTASTSCMPYGLTVQANRLIVADTANSRLLGFELSDLAMAAPATLLTGQTAFGDRGDNRWNPPAADSLCWPYAVAGKGRTVAIADSGNNRVLLWDIA